MKPAIRIENLSKQYRLGTVGTGNLNHDTSASLSVTPKTLVAPLILKDVITMKSA